MKSKNDNLNKFLDFVKFCKENQIRIGPSATEDQVESIGFYKSGHKIKIKKENKGKFTDYCGGKVTSECISRGKNSSDLKIRKRATFAANARKWKHKNGGVIAPDAYRYTDFGNLFS